MIMPKYHETFIPILEILRTGEKLHYKEMRKRVRDTYYSNLSEELLNKTTTTGDHVLLDRIGWGKSYLKLANFLRYPEKGMVQITEKGKAALQSGTLTLRDVKKDQDYLAYRAEWKAKKESKSENEEADSEGANLEDANTEDASPQELIDSGLSEIESRVKDDLLDKLKNIDPFDFQRVILKLLEKMGYGDFVETPKTGDGGIDGIINEDKLGLGKIYIQAKRYNENKVREPDIRNFIGAMSGDTLKGIFVTTSSFDDKAVAKASGASHTIALVGGNKLVDLMYQHDVGVQIRNVYNVKSIDEDFFEEP